MADLSVQGLCALLHLASPQLPVGGFSYSQGLEAAIEHGMVTDADTAHVWVADALAHGFARCEAPLWLLLRRAWAADDAAAVAHWNQWFVASRDSREARAETLQMGWSLHSLLQSVQWGGEAFAPRLQQLRTLVDGPWGLAYPTAFACACAATDAGEDHALLAYGFAWLENQVAAAIKAVPLGQVAGQKLLLALHGRMARMLEESRGRASALPPQLDTIVPQWGLLQARHEHQYSRLFRS
ncbi:MAG: urease accessory protein UreF [Burkholderiaceae bacterium]|jgi:urease accessory protein|nr:urease accessory protein UreF [Burkholderiaceae bacterium]